MSHTGWKKNYWLNRKKGTYLVLEDHMGYTGHAFRRTTAILFANKARGEKVMSLGTETTADI